MSSSPERRYIRYIIVGTTTHTGQCRILFDPSERCPSPSMTFSVMVSYRQVRSITLLSQIVHTTSHLCCHTGANATGVITLSFSVLLLKTMAALVTLALCRHYLHQLSCSDDLFSVSPLPSSASRSVIQNCHCFDDPHFVSSLNSPSLSSRRRSSKCCFL
jgi:hypothetical protein